MDLSILVVSWNTRELLAQCLASIEASPPPCEFEVWVVDNGSVDGSPEMLRAEHPGIRLVANTENVGFARAANQAIRQSSARFVVLLNPDAMVLPGTLKAMLDWMNEHSRTGIVGGTLLHPDGSFQASYADFPGLVSQLLVVAGLARRIYGPYFPSHGPVKAAEAVPADWVGGACLMARRSAVESVGLLDERFFLYAEEMDWCYRMRQAGWGVYSLPAAPCLHWGGQSSRLVRQQTPARLASAGFLFFEKHYGWPRAVLFRLGMIVIGFGRAAVFVGLYLASRAQRADWKEKITANWCLVTAGLGV